MRVSIELNTIQSLIVCTLVCVGQLCEGGDSVSRSSPQLQTVIDEWAATIDRLIDDDLQRNQLQLLEITSDQQFVRRVYLDIVGRIPTLEELRVFLDSQSVKKRGDLIASLLSSPGHVSHDYNFWADILRIKDEDSAISRAFYVSWLKDSLASNKPYDQFVRELVTASGSGWEHGNGAVGYYLRDRGMPLDNMANTLRIFAGTRVACAQCHDHPNDRWTRREFFQMAAYTNDISTGVRDELFGKIYERELATTDERLREFRSTSATLFTQTKWSAHRTARSSFRPAISTTILSLANWLRRIRCLTRCPCRLRRSRAIAAWNLPIGSRRLKTEGLPTSLQTCCGSEPWGVVLWNRLTNVATTHNLRIQNYSSISCN